MRIRFLPDEIESQDGGRNLRNRWGSSCKEGEGGVSPPLKVERRVRVEIWKRLVVREIGEDEGGKEREEIGRAHV